MIKILILFNEEGQYWLKSLVTGDVPFVSVVQHLAHSEYLIHVLNRNKEP